MWAIWGELVKMISYIVSELGYTYTLGLSLCLCVWGGGGGGGFEM